MNHRPIIRVSDVMTADVKTVDRMTNIKDAIDLLKDKNVSSLVVLRHDDADELGVVTIRDIAREVVATDKPIDRTGVYEVMSKPILTLAAEMNIKYAVRLLIRFNISRAVVIDQNRDPVGIVTLRDMVLGYGRLSG